MADSQLTFHLLDVSESLLAYTVEVTQNALSNSSNLDAATKLAQKRARTRARLALEFWVSVLDSGVERERIQREVFEKYLRELDALPVIDRVDIDELTTSLTPTTTTQRVLSLPDILIEIISHISPRTRQGRATLRAASLISRSFHAIANPILWNHPRDLENIERQVQFAFGASISGASNGSDSGFLGFQVKSLRIRRLTGGCNERVIVKIAQLCPNVEDFLLHCGERDEEERVTHTFITTIHSILSSFSNLKDLSLTKFSFTRLSEPFVLADASNPFMNLRSLRLFDFWWPALLEGLGVSLRSLEIGSLISPSPSTEQLVILARKTPSLRSLSIPSFIAAECLREFAVTSGHGLTSLIFSQNLFYRDHRFRTEIIEVIVNNLFSLTTLILRGVLVGVAEVKMLTEFKAPLEVAEFLVGSVVQEDEFIRITVGFVQSKKGTLRSINVYFEGPIRLIPLNSVPIIAALGECAYLEDIFIPFGDLSDRWDRTWTGLSDECVLATENLLRGCPRLRLTPDLEAICEGNVVYEREFKREVRRRLQQAEMRKDRAEEGSRLGRY